MTHALRRVLLILTTGILFSAPAAALEIALVISHKGGAYGLFAEALAASVAASRHQLTDGGNLDEGIHDAGIDEADLIVTSGFAATEAILKLGNKPVLAALISRAQYVSLRQAYPGEFLSAIVLDQPPARQVALMVAALPESERFGILLGPDTMNLEAKFVAAAAASGRELIVQRLSTVTELLPALDYTLSSGDALLALADPLLTTPVAARSVLLSSYRYGRPVFAHSKAYVDAGALAAVYSTPSHAARDVSDWLNELDGNSMQQAEMREPRRFVVAINAQVARALNIDLADVATIMKRIRQGVHP